MANNTYDRVTERILELMDKGVCPWRQPWSTKTEPPQNFVTGRHYSGMNFFLLNCSGYQSPHFMTFLQVHERGGHIKAGSHGFPVVYWGTMDGAAKDGPESVSQNGEDKKDDVRFLRSYTVFNAAQIDGIQFPEPAGKEDTPFNPNQSADAIVQGWKDGPEVIHGTSRASYDTVKDVIYLPAPKDFSRPEEYYSTRFHEMGHATGAPNRLNRPIQNRFGDPMYSREELVAEMSSAFLCAKCGIDNVVIENQAAYLQGWTTAMRGDSRLVVTAAGQAQRAANYIQGITYEPPQIEPTRESASRHVVPTPHDTPAMKRPVRTKSRSMTIEM
jgi:antirestriction protein ArdC